MSISAQGTDEYRRTETVGDTTTSRSVPGPTNAFDGPSFIVGVLGNDTRFDVAQPPSDHGGTLVLTVNGEELAKRFAG